MLSGGRVECVVGLRSTITRCWGRNLLPALQVDMVVEDCSSLPYIIFQDLPAPAVRTMRDHANEKQPVDEALTPEHSALRSLPMGLRATRIAG